MKTPTFELLDSECCGPAPIPVKHTSKKIDRRKPPLILYWGYPWHDKSSGAPDGEKIGICETTYDRSRIIEADAIAFHYTTIRAEDLPWKYYRYLYVDKFLLILVDLKERELDWLDLKI